MGIGEDDGIPQEEYFVTGFYGLDGKVYPQVGIFSFIPSSWVLKGDFLDPKSPYLREHIEGEISRDRKHILTFEKHHGNEVIRYVLDKVKPSKDIGGDYRGTWVRLVDGQYHGRDGATMTLERMTVPKI